MATARTALVRSSQHQLHPKVLAVQEEHDLTDTQARMLPALLREHEINLKTFNSLLNEGASFEEIVQMLESRAHFYSVKDKVKVSLTRLNLFLNEFPEVSREPEAVTAILEEIYRHCAKLYLDTILAKLVTYHQVYPTFTPEELLELMDVHETGVEKDTEEEF